MNFDKSRVYTAVNADEVEVGSKVYVADSLEVLQSYVEDDCDTSTITSITSTITRIMPECYRGRFKVDGYDYTFALAYLVSEPNKKKLEWSNLKIGDVIRNKNEIRMITGISLNSGCLGMHILTGNSWFSDEELEEWEKVEEKMFSSKTLFSNVCFNKENKENDS